MMFNPSKEYELLWEQYKKETDPDKKAELLKKANDSFLETLDYMNRCFGNDD